MRRYWSPRGYARETGEDYGNGTYLIVNERVFADHAPVGAGRQSGVTISELSSDNAGAVTTSDPAGAQANKKNM